MHCPRCGTTATVGQQFCRSCGFNLEKVSESFAEQVAAQEAQPGIDVTRLRERQLQPERSGGPARLVVFGLALGALLVLAVSALTRSVGLAELFLILVAIAAVVMIGIQTYSESLKGKVLSPPLPKPAGPTGRLEPGQAQRIDSYREPVPTVTEHTTELLVPLKNVETGKMND